MTDQLSRPLAAESWPRGHLVPLVPSSGPGWLSSDAIASPPKAPPQAMHRPDSTPVLSVVIGMSSPVLLRGFRSFVSETTGVRLAGSAGSLNELLECCARLREGVALVDPFLGGHDIQTFMETLNATAPRIRAVLITDGIQPHRVREAVTSGAFGFVGRMADDEEIRTALFAAAQGRRYISADSATQLADSLAQEDPTPRELQVLGLLARGECNKDIARTLGVSLGTVKTHVRAIMSKSGSRSRTEAVHKAYRLGLVRLDS